MGVPHESGIKGIDIEVIQADRSILKPASQVKVTRVVESSVAEELFQCEAWMFDSDWLLASTLIPPVGFDRIGIDFLEEVVIVGAI